jgi:hypothetical protein
VTLRILVQVYRRFGWILCFHLKDCCLFVTCSPYSLTLKTKEVLSSEISQNVNGLQGVKFVKIEIFSNTAMIDNCFTLASCFAYFSTLKKEATCSSEMLVGFQWITWRCIQEERNTRTWSQPCQAGPPKYYTESRKARHDDNVHSCS